VLKLQHIVDFKLETNMDDLLFSNQQLVANQSPVCHWCNSIFYTPLTCTLAPSQPLTCTDLTFGHSPDSCPRG